MTRLLVGKYTHLRAFVVSWAFLSFALLMLCIGALACVCVGIDIVACVFVASTCCACFLAYTALAYVGFAKVLHCTYAWWVQLRVAAHVDTCRWWHLHCWALLGPRW